MRALIWFTAVLATLWSGYWFVGSRAAKAGAEGWLTQSGAQYQALTVAGFPNRFDLTVEGIKFTDPARGITWQAPFAQAFAMTWKPWHLIAALPHDQTITLPDQTLNLASSRLMGSLLLVPRTDLALKEMVAEGEDLRLTSSAGWGMAADKLVISTRLDPTRATAHRLGLSVTDVAPDPAAISAFAATGLPARITEVYVDATADLSAPLNRHAADSHPQITALNLTEARLIWGALKLNAKGDLAADASGFASGEIGLRVEGWQNLPPVLAALGVITPDFAPTLQRGLQVMVQAGDTPDVLTLALTAKDGRMALGPFPLGAAPYWGTDQRQ